MNINTNNSENSTENNSIKDEIKKAFQQITSGIYPEPFNTLTIREGYNQADNVISIFDLDCLINNSKVLACFMLVDESGRKTIECNNRFIFENIKFYIKEHKFINDICSGYVFNRFNPYVEIFIRNLNDLLGSEIGQYLNASQGLHQEYRDQNLLKFCGLMNHFILNIKKEASSSEFKIAFNHYQD